MELELSRPWPTTSGSRSPENEAHTAEWEACCIPDQEGSAWALHRQVQAAAHTLAFQSLVGSTLEEREECSYQTRGVVPRTLQSPCHGRDRGKIHEKVAPDSCHDHQIQGQGKKLELGSCHGHSIREPNRKQERDSCRDPLSWGESRLERDRREGPDSCHDHQSQGQGKKLELGSCRGHSIREPDRKQERDSCHDRPSWGENRLG